MFTEKERIVSAENYEISKKIYYLFKKYKDYDEKSAIQETQAMENLTKYNPDDLFKNRRKKENNDSNVHEVALVEVKKENWFMKLIKKIWKMKN